MKVTLVAKENAHVVWTAMEDDIQQVIEKQGVELSALSIRACLVAATMQLWLCAIESQVLGWAITEVVNYQTRRRLRFVLLGGLRMDMWLKQIDLVEQWAFEMGIEEAEAWVRPGLRKKLETFGYEKVYEVVTKKLEKRVIV